MRLNLSVKADNISFLQNSDSSYLIALSVDGNKRRQKRYYYYRCIDSRGVIFTRNVKKVHRVILAPQGIVDYVKMRIEVDGLPIVLEE